MQQTKDEIIKAEILDKAGKLFQRYGLQKTTMEDIAKAVGKGKSTLYYYYKSKEDIFEAVVRKEKNAVFFRIQEAVSKAGTATEKLETLMRVKMRELQKMTTLYQVVISEVRANNELEMNVRRSYDDTEIELVKSVLQYGIVTGEFRNYDQQEIDILAFLIVNSQRGVEVALIMDNRLDEVIEKMDMLQGLCMNGLKK